MFKDPLRSIFERNSLFAVLTATSARPLDWGWYADDTLDLIPHFLRNSFVILAINSGPPSLASSSGAPNVAMKDLKQDISPRAPDQVLPEGVEYTSDHPDRRSPITK